MAVGDFNGDGKTDLVIANNRSGTLGVLLGYGDGTFANAVDFTGGGISPNAVAAGDFNGDGRTDLAVAYSASVGVLLNSGNGNFTGQVYTIVGPPSTPVDSDGTANQVAEGAAAGTYVGLTASSTDVNSLAVSYSLTADTSGGGFQINASTGVVTVLDPTKIDYESSPGHAYTVTVQASDGFSPSSQTFTIAVTNVPPSVPLDSDGTTNSVVEGAAAGTTVGLTASSTDVNGPAVIYSLIGDTSNGGFQINASTGVVTVLDPTKINYESSPGHAYTVTVQASDGYATSSQTFTIAVTKARAVYS